MRRYRNLLVRSGITLALAAGLGACVDPGAQGDLGSVEQLSFLGDLGVALGSPVVTGSTTGRSNDYQASCASSNAPDASYTWTAPSSGTYVFSTIGSSFDTVLEVRTYNTGTSLGCNDDSNGTLQSTVSASLSGGQTVIVVIDGFSTANGAYQLNINGNTSIPTSGLHLWLRADAGVNAPGNRMAQWADQSGNGRNASMATPSRQPFFISSALNGRPVIRFTGAESMYLDVFAQPTTFSMFAVGKNSNPSDASGSFSMILGPGGNSPNNQLRWEQGTGALFVGTGNNLPIITSSIGNNRVYHALSALYNGSTMNVYRDGNFVSSNSFSTTGPWTLASVGSWYSTYFMQGDLAEVIIYDRALSESDRLVVSAYLRGKYGLP